MAKYIIQSGDTLSGIATKNKKSIEDILKVNPYITNPNKISAGQSLDIPDSTPSPTPNTNTTGTGGSSSSPIKDAITQKSPRDLLLEKMTSYFENKPDTTKSEALSTQAEDYTTQINKTFDLLKGLRQNIKERTGGYIVSEPQRTRLEAAESAPLTAGLETLQRGKEGVLEQIKTNQAQQKAPLEELKSLADVYKTYETATTPSVSEQYGTGAVGEYNFYSAQERAAGRTPMSWNEYQNLDANRKAKITAGVGGTGLTTQEASIFNGIVGKYNASPLIAAADRTTVLKDTIKNVKANPSDAAMQLNLVYAYIQALDTYQSAVREGELGLVNSIDSKIGQLQGEVQKINNGQIVRPEVALQIADAAEKIVNTIKTAAAQKERSFQSQAETVGLGDAWKNYISGFNQSYGESNKQYTDFSW